MANQTAYLDDMLRWSLDWLMKVRDARLPFTPSIPTTHTAFCV